MKIGKNRTREGLALEHTRGRKQKIQTKNREKKPALEHFYGLSRPELLTITEGKKTWQGADQLWYADEWKQKAGCGPTAASVMASYLAQTRPSCAALYPSGSQAKADFTALMGELWQYVTPGKRGVNRPRLFAKGFHTFGSAKGVELPLRELDIPRFKLARPTADQCAAFLRSALSTDAPVAWMNLHHGEVEHLDNWHWVTIIALEERSDGALLCTFLDSGKELTADFRLWFQTTKLGGGLVSVGETP